MLDVTNVLAQMVQKEFNDIVPQNRRLVFTVKARIVLEQIIKSAKLQNKKMIIPAFTWEGFIPIFLKYNITPIFVDIDPETFHMDRRFVEENLNTDTSAIMIDHIYGLPDPAIDTYRSLAVKNDLVLIEDCARALGAKHKGQLVGSFGQYAFYCLYKCMLVPNGGLGIGEIIDESLCTPKIEIGDLINFSLKVDYPFKRIVAPGLRSLQIRYDDTLEENGISRLKLKPRELDWLNKAIFYLNVPFYRNNLKYRRVNAHILMEELEDFGFIPQKDPYRDHIYTFVGARVPEECDNEKMFSSLLKAGVEAQLLWRRIIIKNGYVRKKWCIDLKDFPRSVELAERIIAFPYTSYLRFNQIQKIRKALQRILQ
jgi:dTDP-4-amino-4,6-dideoxygalactose transaminase